MSQLSLDMGGGYFRCYRRDLDAFDPIDGWVWTRIVADAAYAETSRNGVVLQRGEVLLSYGRLVEWAGNDGRWTTSTARAFVERLLREERIAFVRRVGQRGSVYQVVGYDARQGGAEKRPETASEDPPKTLPEGAPRGDFKRTPGRIVSAHPAHTSNRSSAGSGGPPPHSERTPGAPPSAHVLNKEEKKEERKEEEGGVLVRFADPIADEFELLWRLWPKKAKRKDALRSLRKARRTPTTDRPPDPDALQAIVRHHVSANGWAGSEIRWCPMLSTWLNGQRWTDEVPQRRPPPNRARFGHAHPDDHNDGIDF